MNEVDFVRYVASMETGNLDDVIVMAQEIVADLEAEFLPPDADLLDRPVDTWSSASRQHFIDTGRYLRDGETC